MMYGNQAQEPCTTPETLVATREPVAAEICKFAAELAERAEMLADRVSDKLNPVTTSACSQPVHGEGKECREYPPLFTELRSRFCSLANSLNSIEDTISRVEV